MQCQGARTNFFGRFCTALSARAPEILFGAVRSAAAAHAEPFFSFSVRSLHLCRGASDSFIFFSDRSLCRPRSKENIFFVFVTSMQKCEGGRVRRKYFFCHSRASVSCQGAMQIFVFYPQPCSNAGRAELFFCAAFCFCVWSLSASFDSLRSNFFVTGRCVARAAKKIFFFVFVTSVQKCEGGRVRRKYFFVTAEQACPVRAPCRFLFFIHSHAQMQGAQNFSFAQLFFAVRSHLRRHFVLIFCGAWNLCSTLFQNPASEI
jgi:hypothetical protein